MRISDSIAWAQLGGAGGFACLAQVIFTAPKSRKPLSATARLPRYLNLNGKKTKHDKTSRAEHPGRFRPSRNNKCEDPQRHDGMDKAKLTKQPFGDLRIYFDGP